MSTSFVWRSVFTIGLVICFSSAVFAQAMQPSAVQQIQAILQEKLNRTPAQQKLDSHIHLATQAASGAVTQSTMPSLPNMVKSLEFNEQGHVHVDIQGTVTPALLDEIVALGGTVESSFPNYGAIRAWIPLSAAETLAGRDDVTFIKPAAKAATNTRPIDTKALVSHRADEVLNLGFTGSGVKVGVLSGTSWLDRLIAPAPPPPATIEAEVAAYREGILLGGYIMPLKVKLDAPTASAGQAQSQSSPPTTAPAAPPPSPTSGGRS